MSEQSPELPPAAWYQDPQNPAQLRWWDGSQWTENTSLPPSGDNPQAQASDHALPDWAGPSLEAEEWREFPAPSDVVVGEGRWQEILKRITGAPREEGYEVPINATLLREPDNPHDGNAIAVYLSRNDDPEAAKFPDGDSQVGFIQAEMAAELAPLIDSATGRQSGGVAGVPGLVVGGWLTAPNFGVKLYLSAIAKQIGLDEELLYEYSSPLFPGQAEVGDEDEEDHEDEEVDDADGGVQGRHFTTYVEQVKQLKRDGEYEQALQLLEQLMQATERESATDGAGVAPWYYEQSAIIHRKLGQQQEEIQVLERYESQKPAPGATPSELAERLAKLRAKES